MPHCKLENIQDRKKLLKNTDLLLTYSKTHL